MAVEALSAVVVRINLRLFEHGQRMAKATAMKPAMMAMEPRLYRTPIVGSPNEFAAARSSV